MHYICFSIQRAALIWLWDFDNCDLLEKRTNKKEAICLFFICLNWLLLTCFRFGSDI